MGSRMAGRPEGRQMSGRSTGETVGGCIQVVLWWVGTQALHLDRLWLQSQHY